MNMEVAVSDGDFSTREEAHRICKDYLEGAWNEIDSSSIIIRNLQGGYLNKIYYCSLPDEKRPSNREPKEAILRIFGTNVKGNDGIMNETISFISLANEMLGPQLYGVFPGGRLEEFIPGNILTHETAFEPKMCTSIAKRLAKIHSLQPPLNRDPAGFLQTLKRNSLSGRKKFKPEDWTGRERINAEFVLSHDIEAEADWCSDLFRSLNLPKVFSHNDVRPANIIWRNPNSQNLENELFFVDVEFSCYYYRGNDFASFFSHYCYDLSVSEYPYFAYDKKKYPSMEDQLLFIRSYLESMNCGSQENNEIDTEEHILKEIEVLRLGLFLLPALIVCASVQKPLDNFGVWESTKMSLEMYFEEKKELLDKMKKGHLTL